MRFLRQYIGHLGVNASQPLGARGFALTSLRRRFVVFVGCIHGRLGTLGVRGSMIVGGILEGTALLERRSIDVTWLHRCCKRPPADRGLAGIVGRIGSGIDQTCSSGDWVLLSRKRCFSW